MLHKSPQPEPAGWTCPATCGPICPADRWVVGPPEAKTTTVYEYPVVVPGETLLPEVHGLLTADVMDRPSAPDPRQVSPTTALLDRDLVQPPLVVRSPRPGDRFAPLGMSGTKKLSDFFIDSGIAAPKRQTTPLVCDAAGIIWVGGLRPGAPGQVDRIDRPCTGLAVEIFINYGLFDLISLTWAWFLNMI